MRPRARTDNYRNFLCYSNLHPGAHHAASSIDPLTAAFALTAQCHEGKTKTDYYDTAITGFVLECRSTGGRTYYLRYFDPNGAQKQHKIAKHGDVTFDRARKEALRLRSEVVLGNDPSADKKQRKAVSVYIEVADQHLAYAKLHQRSYATTEMYMRRHILPRWAKLKLTDITQHDVAVWLAEKIAGGLAPATAEKMRVIFGRSFELAKRWGIPGSERNPTHGLPRKPLNNARERFLSAAEAARLSVAVARSRNPQLRFIVGLLLLTGARVGELLRAEWQHVHLDRKAWLIPTSKTGKARHVPLSGAAIELIGQIPRATGSAYLFPSPKDASKPITTIKHSWDHARRAALLGDVRIHDLRHSAASFMINAGVDLFAVGKVLGHASYQSTQRYSHLANDTLLAAVEAGAAKLNMDWVNLA